MHPTPPELESIIESRVDEIYRAAIANNGTTVGGNPIGQGTGIQQSSKGKKVEVLISFCEERIKRTWYSKSVE